MLRIFLPYTDLLTLEEQMVQWKLWVGALVCAVTLSVGTAPPAEASSGKSSVSAKKSTKAKSVRKAKGSSKISSRTVRKVVRRAPAVPSVGQLAGLRDTRTRRARQRRA